MFRVTEKFITIRLRHSSANSLKINLQYSGDLFILPLSDNGLGFNPVIAESKNGSGLKNILNRTNLIGTGVKIDSVVGKGSEIRVSLNPFELKLYADGNNPGSFG